MKYNNHPKNTKKISNKTFGGQFWRGLGQKQFHTTHKKYWTEIATRREWRVNAKSLELCPDPGPAALWDNPSLVVSLRTYISISIYRPIYRQNNAIFDSPYYLLASISDHIFPARAITSITRWRGPTHYLVSISMHSLRYCNETVVILPNFLSRNSVHFYRSRN